VQVQLILTLVVAFLAGFSVTTMLRLARLRERTELDFKQLHRLFQALSHDVTRQEIRLRTLEGGPSAVSVPFARLTEAGLAEVKRAFAAQAEPLEPTINEQRLSERLPPIADPLDLFAPVSPFSPFLPVNEASALEAARPEPPPAEPLPAEAPDPSPPPEPANDGWSSASESAGSASVDYGSSSDAGYSSSDASSGYDSCDCSGGCDAGGGGE
jgi:hypothetical protein